MTAAMQFLRFDGYAYSFFKVDYILTYYFNGATIVTVKKLWYMPAEPNSLKR